MITKWIRHTRKIAVTTVTFQLFGGPRDTWLPNWMKWYSNPNSTIFSCMSSATDDFPKLTHGNYHAWAPRMTAKLQCLGVWRFCIGDESIPMEKPTAMPLPTDASTSKKLTATRNLTDATQNYNDTCRRNDQAVGVIMTKIEPSEYSGLEKKSQLRKFGMP